MHRYLPLTILYVCIKYVENYSSYCVRMIVWTNFWPWPLTPQVQNVYVSCSCHFTSMHVCWKLLKLSCHNQSVSKLSFHLDPQNKKASSSHHPASVYDIKRYMLETTQVILSEPKFSLWHWSLSFWTKNAYVFSSHHHASMYEIQCMNTISRKRVDKLQFLTLTYDLLTPKCIGIFLSPLCIYVYKIRAVHWKLPKLSCQNKSVDKVQLKPWPWPFDPKMYRFLSLIILHLCLKYESCMLKTTQVIVSEPKCWQSSVVTLIFDLLALKCIGIFLSSSCIYVCNMKTVWKLLKLSCQNQSVDGRTDGQTWFLQGTSLVAGPCSKVLVDRRSLVIIMFIPLNWRYTTHVILLWIRMIYCFVFIYMSLSLTLIIMIKLKHIG